MTTQITAQVPDELVMLASWYQELLNISTDQLVSAAFAYLVAMQDIPLPEWLTEQEERDGLRARLADGSDSPEGSALWNRLDCRGMRDFIRREKYKDYFDL